MNKIHQLPHDIVAKIAAGEVIERPVFAVKELFENALDAKADLINVHIEESGLKKIVVIDNGEGMNPEDLQLSFKSHATSKLTKADDLSHISTLGFRGEALSSIAAISRLTIQSKRMESPIGTRVVIKNSNVEKIAPIGMPDGTIITVEQLFHSLPARKKILKSQRTEFRLILELLIGYAFSYPNIHFVLTHNNKTVLDLPKSIDPLGRIEKLLGNDIFSSLIPISFTESYISISGFIAKPTITTRTPHKQFLFINNRLVQDKGVSLAVKSAYGSLLPNNTYPVCLLFFTLPFEMVDVNVHPRKEYVRFADQQLLHDTTDRAVSQALARYDLMPQITYDSLFLNDAPRSTQSYAGKLLKEKKMPWELTQVIDYSHISQIAHLYLLSTTNEGLFLIDQHAAHERILYEQLLAEYTKEKKKANIFHFPKPGIFELSLSESEILNEYLASFQQLGWEIEHFKDTSYLLRSLPVLFQDRDYVKLLREVLEDIKITNRPQEIDSITRKMITYLACRGAVKAGDKLTKKQAKELAEQLEKTEHNATCPHGRPTKVFIELEKINKLFKR